MLEDDHLVRDEREEQVQRELTGTVRGRQANGIEVATEPDDSGDERPADRDVDGHRQGQLSWLPDREADRIGAESRSERRQGEARHPPIVARTRLDENPEIRRSGVSIDAPAPARAIASVASTRTKGPT
jgi:hypothetical protein